MYPMMPQQSREASAEGDEDEEEEEDGGPSVRCFCVMRNLLCICDSIGDRQEGEEKEEGDGRV